MDELEIVKVLNRYNPWWDGRAISEGKTILFKRGDFYEISRNLNRKEIVSIVGPRRVGKTILIHQLIKELLDKGIDSKKILYLSVDEVEFVKGSVELKDVFEVYFKYIVKMPLNELSDTHYLFLDEIQELENWEKILKNWYDLGYKIKFIISGSSSIWISKGSEESLLGRIKTSVMMPLKFSEVLRYRGIISEEFQEEKKKIHSTLIKSIESKNAILLKGELEKFAGLMASKRDIIEIELNRYLISGGYPEFLDEKSYERIAESIRDKIKLIFFKDIVRYFRIRNSSVLEDLFKLLSKNSGNFFNIIKTAEILGIQRPTLKDYLKYLSKAYLIKNSEFYSGSRKTRIRKQNKIYVLDSGVRNGISDYLDESLLNDETELGMIVQGVVFDHLLRLKFNLEPGPETEIFYWNNKKEIDFVMEIKRTGIPFEVKYRNKLPDSTIEEIEAFLNEKKSPFGFVITKNLFKLEGNVLRLPLWLFLLIV